MSVKNKSGSSFLAAMVVISILCGSAVSVSAAEIDPASGLSYTLSDTGATISSFTAPAGFSGVLVIPDTLGGKAVVNIGVSAFHEKDSITSISIPNTVTTIDIYAFYGCDGLTRLAIPASVTSFNLWEVKSMKNLAEISVDPANTVYKSMDGMLYSKDGLTLYVCPHAKSGAVSVARGTKTIAGNAFFANYGLTSINFPEGLLKIGESAFYGCRGLTNVRIPSTVTELGEMAFLFSYVNKFEFLDSVAVLGRASLQAYPPTGTVTFSVPSWELNYYAASLTSNVTGITGTYTSIIETPMTLCQIDYINRDGSAFTADSRPYNTICTSVPNAPSDNPGYAFLGWFADEAYTMPFVQGGRILEDMTVYSGWEAYTVYCRTDPASGLIYSVYGGESFIEGFETRPGFAGDLVIPAVLGGYPVTSINDYALYGDTVVAAVTVPESVISIGDYAFSNSAVSNFTFLGQVDTFGSRVFSDTGCTGVRTFIVPAGSLSYYRGILSGWMTGETSPNIYDPAAGFSVSYLNSDGSEYSTVSAEIASLITAPAAPSLAGYSFVGWYKDTALLNPWNFATDTVVSNIVLYPGYISLGVPQLTVTAKSYNSAALSWNTIGRASGYEVYKSSSSSGTYTVAGSTSAMSYIDTGLVTGAGCYYKIRSYCEINGMKVYGSYSGSVYVVTKLDTPANLSAVSTKGRITLAWSAVPGATQYQIYRSTDASAAYTLVKTTTSLSFIDTAITRNKTYNYLVRAVRTNTGVTAYSDYSSKLSKKYTY